MQDFLLVCESDIGFSLHADDIAYVFSLFAVYVSIQRVEENCRATNGFSSLLLLLYLSLPHSRHSHRHLAICNGPEGLKT
jgi:hypothetical protein